MIRNIVKEELQTYEVILQEIVGSNLKVTIELLEKLSGEVRNRIGSLEFIQKQLKDKTKMIKKTLKYYKKI